MIGFVESKIMLLAQSLEQELRRFDSVLVDSQSPYTKGLKSTIVITLPVFA
jgi:hypothetical protein